MSSPFFSIVIPTRNRATTLKYSMETILNQTFEDFELIISDNSSNDETFKLLETYDDKRISYQRTNGMLSMVDNWEYALKFITGKYVLYIGDDDGLLINALSISFDKITSKLPEVLMFNWLGYNWPEQLDTKLISNLISLPNNNDTEGFINSEATLKNVIASKTTYNTLPAIYYSFVSSKLITSLIAPNGRFFNSLIPDVYTGILICHFSKSIYKTNDLLGIRGTSSQSNGAAHGVKNEKNQFLQDDFKKLNNESSVKWNTNAPNIFCYYAFSLECYLQLCQVYKIHIPKRMWLMCYFKIIRRIYFDYSFDKNKVKDDLNIIRRVIKNNNKIPTIYKMLLLFYNRKLSDKNEERTLLDHAKSSNFGFNRTALAINGANFKIANILDLQIFLSKLLN